MGGRGTVDAVVEVDVGVDVGATTTARALWAA
jgi:hypothetical protein